MASDNSIILRLFELQDEKYKKFQCNLMPTVDRETVIGVRTPMLRKLAAEIWRQGDALLFMNELPHKYYEENNLHAFLIERIPDFDKCIHEIERFLPYIDNWATCDSLSPRILAENKRRLYDYIKKWIRSDHTYTVRFAIKLLISLYSSEDFSEEYLELVAKIRSDEYYVKMVMAWYFASLMVCHYDKVIPYLVDKRLDAWVHNKTIQKAVDSYRISNERKEFLKTLRRKMIVK